MEQDGSDDPRRLIFHFLDGLPETIKLDVLAFVVILSTRAFPSDTSNQGMADAVTALLFDTRDIFATGAVVCVAAALDYTLEHAVAEAPETIGFIKAAAQQIPSLEGSVLRHPMRSRHYERALSDWRALRTTRLTAVQLRDFERSLLARMSIR
jgi:hypothetical protein